jgi:hypothetical protein
MRSAQAAGDEWGALVAVLNLGIAHLYRDDLAAAGEHLRRGLARAGALGDDALATEFLTGLATVDAGTGQAARGAGLMGAVAALRSATGATSFDAAVHEAAQERARRELGEDAFDAAWAAGRTWDLVRAVAVASGPAAADGASGG